MNASGTASRGPCSGSARSFGSALYSHAGERYEDAVLLTGSPVGTPRKHSTPPAPSISLSRRHRAAGLEIIEKTRVFPLRDRELDREPMRFPNASGVPVEMLYPRDATYSAKLTAFVEQEPVDMVDQITRGLMASIGNIKGQPFNPPEQVRKVLDAAAQTAPQMIVSLGRGTA